MMLSYLGSSFCTVSTADSLRLQLTELQQPASLLPLCVAIVTHATVSSCIVTTSLRCHHNYSKEATATSTYAVSSLPLYTFQLPTPQTSCHTAVAILMLIPPVLLVSVEKKTLLYLSKIINEKFNF